MDSLALLLILVLVVCFHSKTISSKSSTSSSISSPSLNDHIIKLTYINGGSKKKAKKIIDDNDDNDDNDKALKPKYKPREGSISVDINAFISKFWSYCKSILFKQKTYGSKKNTSSNIGKAVGSTSANNRLQKEIKQFLENPPDNCKLNVGSNIRVWVINIKGSAGTIYAGEEYKLKMVFPKDYPSKPPSVYFLKPCPRHEHVYSNGDICLNLLGRDWRPTLTAQTLAVSILSMLSSAKEKTLPQDNAMHADSQPGMQQENWMYHDDRC